MPTYTIEVPDDDERGIEIACEDHGERGAFQPGYRTVAFHCSGCGYELEVDVRDLHDWRDLGEMC